MPLKRRGFRTNEPLDIENEGKEKILYCNCLIPPLYGPNPSYFPPHGTAIYLFITRQRSAASHQAQERKKEEGGMHPPDPYSHSCPATGRSMMGECFINVAESIITNSGHRGRWKKRSRMIRDCRLKSVARPIRCRGQQGPRTAEPTPLRAVPAPCRSHLGASFH